MPNRTAHPRPPGGFTLIELMAVILIFGLLAGIALPNLGVRSQRVLRDQARRLANEIEFVRQRAVMTGKAHRLIFDLDDMTYTVEWYASDGSEPDAAEPDPRTGEMPLAMSPPRRENPAFRRPMGTLGDVHRLHEAVFIDHVETPDGRFDREELHLTFQSDGTSEPTWIVLADDSGRSRTLTIEPLADSVSIDDGRL